jgi:hypothetical protein
MQLSLLSESLDWKLDVVESYKEISPNDTYLNSEVKSNKGDELEFVTYLAFLESTSATNLKSGITIRVELIIDNDTGVAWIDWIGAGPNRYTKDIGKIPGYTSLRQLLAKIAKQHPNIRYFVGDRITGMREKHPNHNQGEFKLAANKL